MKKYVVLQFTRGCSGCAVVERFTEADKEKKPREVADFNIEHATQLPYRGVYEDKP